MWVESLYPKKNEVFDADKAWDRFNNTLDQKERRIIMRHRFVKYASSIAAIFIVAIGLLQIFRSKPEMKRFTTPQKTDLYFNDGSFACMNKNSEIDYPEKFFGDTREISIFGEAFFNVRSNKEKPFIVKAGDYRIEVLGTKFNVKNIDEGKYEVYLEKGKVSVYHKDSPDKNKILLPGQMVLLSKDGISYENNFSENYLSWKNDKLIFHNSLLKDAIVDIENYYGVSISIDDAQKVGQLRLTAQFENKTLDEVLDVITLIFDLEKEKRDTKILLIPKK